MSTDVKVGPTPGPWSQSHREKPDGMWSTEVYDTQGETIATLAWYPVVTGAGVIETSREANARLIASAPDLLAACKSALGWYGLDGDGISDPTLTQLRTAIAKAEGRS